MQTSSPARQWSLGPAVMVTAAFIGPGTVTTAWMAGARYQLSLLWVVILSALAAILLQEMAARLGVLTGHGLGESLRGHFTHPFARGATAALVIVAIGVGNAAYQTGNLLGAAIGLQKLVGLDMHWLILSVVGTAAVLLATGSYRTVEGCLISFVALMGVTFVISAVISSTHSDFPLSTIVSAFPPHSFLTVLALVGTTIVPYNLFLHASAAAKRWSATTNHDEALRAARRDCVISITIGGVITAAILVTAAVTMQGRDPNSVQGMATALNTALGDTAARWMFASGLAAAGLTSAITAPLAAAYAISGILGWSTDPHRWSFRVIWILILGCGTILAMTFGKSPLQTIVVAQAANAVLLPCIAAFLWTVCHGQLLGKHRNGRLTNVLVACLLLSLAGLSAWNIWKLI